jgi:hypothetical protein
MSKHVIVAGKEAITDIGFLVGREMNRLNREVERGTELAEGHRTDYFLKRVKELEHQLDKMKAYDKLFLGATSIEITHGNVDPEEG